MRPILSFLILFILLPLRPFTAKAQTNTGNLLYQPIDPTTTKVQAIHFETWLKSHLKLENEIELRALQSETDHLGFTHQRYQVAQAGIPIEGSVLISHSDPQKNITAYNGSLFDTKNIDKQATITPKEALNTAIQYVGATVYRWEIEAENEHRKHLHQDKAKSYLPTPKLVIVPTNLDFKTQDFHLAYKIDIYALEPLQRQWIYVDAKTGEVIATQNQLCTLHSPPSKNPSTASTVGKVLDHCQSFRFYAPNSTNSLSVSPSLRSISSPVSKPLCASVSPCSSPINTLCASVPPCSSPINTLCASVPPCSSPINTLCASVPPCSIPKSDTPAIAITKYSGIQTITTDQQNSTYLLQETARNIFTYNMHQNNLFANATIFEDEDNYWDNFNAQQDEVATDVHWATERTYDYFLETFGRKSFDGNGIAIRSYVHYLRPIFSDVYANAFWDGEHLTYGDGDNERRSAMTSLDICAHEFTHAITDYTANLINARESGALNESFSDIFAIAVEHYAKPSTANFLLGEEVALGETDAIRSAIAPKTLEAPDTYNGEYWNKIETHNRSNVQTHWFYLLVNGGTGINDFDHAYEVEGIGLEAAIAIAYRNLTVYLTPPATYADARFFSIRAAMDLFGDCSAEVQQVANAWYAVGVGESELKVEARFEADETDFCSSQEATVHFLNHSIYANSYQWDFGDGTNSLEINPTHTYQSSGEYTVQLITTSCNGDQDTLTKEKWIHIEAESPYCNEIIFNPIEQQNLNDCKGTFYDDGGKSGDYTRNKKSQVTIEVAEADHITLDFKQFDLSNNHELYIYDGNSQNASLIGYYFGSRFPEDGATIVSKGNALHLYFDASDGPTSTEERTFPGFEAVWACHNTNRKPLASFTSNNVFICQGQVSFTESCLYQAMEWFWDFGDGNTSQEANPVHTYQKNGKYDVQLIACNDFGCDTLKQNAFIKINKESDNCYQARVPQSGKTTVNNCQGVIYDHAGANSYYSNNANGILVVSPPASERLGFVIQTFNTEIQDDVLLIYDGTDTDAPLLLSQSGTSFPKDTIWAESGAITLHFRSSPSTINQGFEIFYFSVPKAENPTAAFLWNPSNPPLEVPISFNNQSIVANQWHWDFGDGKSSSLKSPAHVYTESGDYEVILTAKNCFAADTLQKQINVQSKPNLEVSPQNIHLTLVAGNSSNQTIHLSNVGAGDLYFGTKTKAFEQDIVVEKYYTNLGIDEYVFEQVHPLQKFQLEVTINGDFDASDEFLWVKIEDSPLLQVGDNNQSAPNGTDITEVFTFDIDGANVEKWLEDQQLKIQVGKSNQVNLEEGGEDYYKIRLVTDHAKWLKTAVSNGVVEGTANKDVQITFDASDLWEGTYFNELQILTNETDNSPQTVFCTLEVLAHPQANFKQASAVSCNGEIEFQDKSINHLDTWTWDFGDGTTSTEQHPTHTFPQNGDYTVSLTVCKNGDCDSTSKNIFIAPFADFSFPFNNVRHHTPVLFTNKSRGGQTYHWDFGDGTTTTEKHPTHLFEAEGTYEVQLISQTCFQSDTTTKTIHIQAPPKAVLSLDTLKVTIDAGNQSIQKIPIQNTGMGDLYCESGVQKESAESTVIFEEVGQKTEHVFEGVIAEDFLQLKITLNGDFDKTTEKVWLRIEGEGIQSVLDNNMESPDDETHIITLYPPIYRHLLADGQLIVELENSPEVEPRADRTNKHSVQLIAHGIEWLSLVEENQTIAANEIADIEVLFDASNLNSGIYEFPLQIKTNESDESNYLIPTRLEVIGAAAMELSASNIDFGTIRANSSLTKSYEIFNAGTDTLFIGNISTQNPVFEVDTTILVLPPKTTYQGSVAFSPTSISSFAADLEIQSNVGIKTVSLLGTAVGAPKISVTPDSLWVALEVGEQTTRELSVSNTGVNELLFEAQNTTFTRFDSLVVKDFYKIADTTVHVFENLVPADSLQLKFKMFGDYNKPNEYADVYLNGEWKARLGEFNADTIYNVRDSLSLAWSDISNGLEEGKLEVMLVNSEEVNTGITISQAHEVQLKTFDTAWLNVSQNETGVGVNNLETVEVWFDTSHLSVGTYHQDIEVFADDPVRPLTIVPATLVVYERPQANFEVDLQKVCSGAVQFQNLSSENATEWHWNFGDGTTSMDKNPQHIYALPNKYFIELVAAHEFAADTLRFDLVVDFTIADFETPDTVFHHTDFEVVNQSIGAITSLWSFGEGTVITTDNPVFQYDTIGIYTIQLVTQSTNDCLDTLQKEIVVELKVGIEANQLLPDWLRIYPNPVDADLTIEVNKSTLQPIEVTLYNALGQSLRKIRFEGNRQIIHCNELPSGLYYLKLQTGDFTGLQKVVVR
ncbi:MAG: PKD domain-containing protein [Chitinophagales bacterium]